MARPKTGVTPVRNVRIADEVWQPALAKARSRHETITSIVEQALRDYIADTSAPTPTDGNLDA
jgi:hypothetical protein